MPAAPIAASRFPRNFPSRPKSKGKKKFAKTRPNLSTRCSTIEKMRFYVDARAAYLEFWQAFAKANIALEKRDWLKSHVKISRTLARGDSNAQIHLLGTESEADLLENEVLEAELARKQMHSETLCLI